MREAGVPRPGPRTGGRDRSLQDERKDDHHGGCALRDIPQREWETRKKGLNDQVNRAANLLINRLGINRAGRELINAGVAATNNFVASVTLINKELKNGSPAPRQQWSIEQFETVTAELESILNVLTRRYKGVLNGKTKG